LFLIESLGEAGQKIIEKPLIGFAF